MLYELCVGFRPFVAGDVAELLRKHRDEAPIPPRQAASGRRISEPLERVILRALEKDRNVRFADAAAFRAALDETPEGRDSGGAASGAHKRSLVPYAIALVALVVACIGVIAALRH